MKEIIPALRTENVTYAIRDIVVRAKELEAKGKEIVYLNIGDPPVYDFETPKSLRKIVADKIMQSDKDGDLNVSTYCDSMGIIPARKAIVTDAIKNKNIPNITINDVVVTSGASEAITLCISALMDPGENIMTPSPGYPLYSGQIPVYHGEVNPYNLNEETGWQIDFAELEKTVNDKTKAIVVINPNNPTGANYNKESIQNILKFAKKHNLVVLADEIYDKLLMDGNK